MKKRVLIHSIVFNPDGVSTAYLYGDIAAALKEEGMDVVVLTTTPHYNVVEEQTERQPMKWKVWGLLKKSSFKGIPVYHVPQKKFKSTPLRLIGFVYWHLISFFTALFIKKVDVIISPSPPLTIGLLNVWLGKLKNAKVVYNVQEVYPDILGKKSGLVYKVLSRMERFIYNNSQAITTIDAVFYNTIVDRFIDKSKLCVIPNFVDTELYKPVTDFSELDDSMFLRNDNLKLLYAGNIGKAQEWDTLIELAKLSRNEKFDFYVIGEGAKKEYLETNVGDNDLRNVHVLPYQPRENMPQIIAFSDIQFIFMEPEIAAQGFPSKVYTIMASGKPLLVSSPHDTPIVDLLTPIGCAKIVESGSASEKAKEMYEWLRSVTKAQLDAMGKRGVAEATRKYSKAVVTKRYADLLSNL